MKSKPKAILHGECMIYEAKIPCNAKIEKIEGNTGYVIVAPSETTGNHHVIDLPTKGKAKGGKGVEFFQLDGVRYMRAHVETQVRCLQADRHDTVKIAPGDYGIGSQQEFDYFAMAKRNVQD